MMKIEKLVENVIKLSERQKSIKTLIDERQRLEALAREVLQKEMERRLSEIKNELAVLKIEKDIEVKDQAKSHTGLSRLVYIGLGIVVAIQAYMYYIVK